MKKPPPVEIVPVAGHYVDTTDPEAARRVADHASQQKTGNGIAMLRGNDYRWAKTDFYLEHGGFETPAQRAGQETIPVTAINPQEGTTERRRRARRSV